MRKILYSPGYGSGWTTNMDSSSFTLEQIKFAAYYQPFIDALEAHQDDDDFDDSVYETFTYPCGYTTKHQIRKCIFPLLEQFRIDWFKAFGDDAELPYFSALRDIEVLEVPDGCVVKLKEFDGSESYDFVYLDRTVYL